MYFRSKVWIPYKSGFYPDYACFAWSFNSFSCIRSALICKDRYIWRVTARACCCCLLTSGDDDVQEVWRVLAPGCLSVFVVSFFESLDMQRSCIWRVTARSSCCCLLITSDDDSQEVSESLHRAFSLSSLLLSLKAWICKHPCIWGVTARLFLLPSYRVHVRSGLLALIGERGVHLYALPWRAERRTRCWSKVETLRNERREGMEAYLFAVQWASKQAARFLIGLRTKRPSWSTLAASTGNQLPLLLADQIQSSSGIHFTLTLLLGHGTACRSTFT